MNKRVIPFAVAALQLLALDFLTPLSSNAQYIDDVAVVHREKMVPASGSAFEEANMHGVMIFMEPGSVVRMGEYRYFTMGSVFLDKAGNPHVNSDGQLSVVETHARQANCGTQMQRPLPFDWKPWPEDPISGLAARIACGVVTPPGSR